MFTARKIFDLLQPIGGRLDFPEGIISRVVIDSRQIAQGEHSIFVALAGKRSDGHRFVHDAWERGVRNFIIEKDISGLPGPSNVFYVRDAIAALQAIATAHREKFDMPRIGITGSNGKTWVKEWLYQLLHADYDIVKSPRSYNSQIGVPLSVLQIGQMHTLGIFEAGLSEEGEMRQLGDIIMPQIGVLTHLGDAHDAGFPDRETKLREKCQLFNHAHTVVYPANDPWLDAQMRTLLAEKKLISWTEEDDGSIHVNFQLVAEGTRIRYRTDGQSRSVYIPFADGASQYNAATCIGVMVALQVQHETIATRMPHLQPIEMRLEIHQLANQCLLVNDTYSLDLASLRIGLETL
jgi:UDP-N-acetylmuramoyl-tripeptide--D-alanyl-D-alanine ligase